MPASVHKTGAEKADTLGESQPVAAASVVALKAAETWG